MNRRGAMIAVAAMFLAATSSAQEKSSVSTQLSVGGEVQHALTLSVEAFREIGKRREFVKVGAYGGVRLVDLLEEADIRRDSPRALRRTYIVATATDGYQGVFSWGELYNSPIGRGVLVAVERDGVPLRDGEGRFALVSLADDKPGPRHVKWLTRIEVRRVPEAKD
jgi:DMSO/TMAO reductase YedYZ molybdopterin-dependent catalytic subunit